MNKVNSVERGAAAGAALLITLTVVWSMGSMGYPAPASAAPGVTPATNPAQCRPG
jgi:hypothetical protein